MRAKVNPSKSTSKPREVEPTDAYARISRFCAYQERSHEEVRRKLYAFSLRSDVVDELLSKLISDGFVNEERFAKAFSGGKFRIKNWGRLKIEQGLKAHDISSKCIAIGLREIDETDYRDTLKKLIIRKAETTTEENVYKRKDLVSKFVIGKGFEPELVWEMIKEIM